MGIDNGGTTIPTVWTPHSWRWGWWNPGPRRNG